MERWDNISTEKYIIQNRYRMVMFQNLVILEYVKTVFGSVTVVSLLRGHRKFLVETEWLGTCSSNSWMETKRHLSHESWGKAHFWKRWWKDAWKLRKWYISVDCYKRSNPYSMNWNIPKLRPGGNFSIVRWETVDINDGNKTLISPLNQYRLHNR